MAKLAYNKLSQKRFNRVSKQLFIGVDGGATKCAVRVEDADGNVLGSEISGPANIRLSVDQAWQSIQSALEKILNPLGLHPGQCHLHAGMGLAGCELSVAYHAFLQRPHTFTTLVVASDAETACLGAHAGKAGAIIIAGTGVVGFQVQDETTTKISGWGFPHDDDGGGAWLGLHAVKHTLQWLDGRSSPSGLSNRVYARFNQNEEEFIAWANQANSTAFAELAPLVIEQAALDDAVAITLLQQAAEAVNQVERALFNAQFDKHKPLPCAMTGSIAPFLKPYLSDVLQQRLVTCAAEPVAGAIYLVKHHLQNKGR